MKIARRARKAYSKIMKEGEKVVSQCCNGYITEYDKGNGEKYDACYMRYKKVDIENNENVISGSIKW